MTPPRLERVEEIFHAALECEPDQLSAFLGKACAGDEALLGKVEQLLAAHRQAGSFIDNPLANVAHSNIPDDQESDSLIGQTIGHYKISKRIGVGGMGAVYLAERADQQYEKQVAIKLIKRGMDTDSVLRHFRNERQILASFDHPNIARLLDGGATEDGLPYFVMEYVEGLPIDAYCDAHALSITERLKLFREVCGAVSYAHRHAVIHRDIKPSNILVTSDSESACSRTAFGVRERGRTPKLLDFGIAKILQPVGEAEPLATMTGLHLMTPEYASPEQVLGQPLTTATDVYSLGVVLYRLLTGQKPYRLKTGTPEEISRAIIEQEPTRPSNAIAKRDGSSKSQIPNPKLLRGDLDNIVLMALRKESDRRYQSVEQFSEDIRRHLEALPVRARKDTLTYRSAKFVRRNMAATAAAALVFLTLLGGIIATTWQARRTRAEADRAERRFNDVRQLARSVLFDYHDAIKDLPGATRVRERLVKDALTYLDSLAREAGGDPALQRELAAAYERVGDVRGQAFSASLGNRAGAIDSYQKALRIREALVSGAPHDAKNRRDLAVSYKRLGNQLVDTAEAARGLDYLRKSLAILSKLADEEPANTEIHHDLAECYSAVGSALEGRGEMAGALEHHRKALPIYQKLLATDPQDRANRRSVSVTYENIGRALFLSNDLKGALENNHKALALREALLAENPSNADYRRILAVTYQNNGDYQAWSKNIPAALEGFRKKLAIDEQLLAADSANAQARTDLAYSAQRIGDLLSESGQHSEALPHYARALEMSEKNAAADPQDLVVVTRPIQIRARRAKAQARLGDFISAREQCRKATELLRALADDPSNVNLRRERTVTYGDLAEVYVLLAADKSAPPKLVIDEWRSAREMYQRSLQFMEDLRHRGILGADEIPEIEEVRQKIAECDAALAGRE
jgi:eukaryotic-like serine/threonine-protein kinase